MARGLAAFTGAERRFQRLGEIGGVWSSTTMRITPPNCRDDSPRRAGRVPIAASSPPFSRISSRALATSRANSPRRLSLADVVFLTDIYPAREQPMPGVTTISSATRWRRRGAPVWRVGERACLRAIGCGARRRLVDDHRGRDVTRCRPGAARRAPRGAHVTEKEQPGGFFRRLGRRWRLALAGAAARRVARVPLLGAAPVRRLDFFRVWRVRSSAPATLPERAARPARVDTTRSVWEPLEPLAAHV